MGVPSFVCRDSSVVAMSNNTWEGKNDYSW